MLVRFSEDGEAARTGAMGEEDIILRVRGVGGVRWIGGEKSENTRKPQVYIGTKCPQPMGTKSQYTQPIKHSPSSIAQGNMFHQTQPSQDANTRQDISNTI